MDEKSNNVRWHLSASVKRAFNLGMAYMSVFSLMLVPLSSRLKAAGRLELASARVNWLTEEESSHLIKHLSENFLHLQNIIEAGKNAGLISNDPSFYVSPQEGLKLNLALQLTPSILNSLSVYRTIGEKNQSVLDNHESKKFRFSVLVDPKLKEVKIFGEGNTEISGIKINESFVSDHMNLSEFHRTGSVESLRARVNFLIHRLTVGLSTPFDASSNKEGGSAAVIATVGGIVVGVLVGFVTYGIIAGAGLLLPGLLEGKFGGKFFSSLANKLADTRVFKYLLDNPKVLSYLVLAVVVTSAAIAGAKSASYLYKRLTQ